MKDCLFCNISKDEIVCETELFLAKWDSYPVNKGHLLIIPKRHFESYFDMYWKEAHILLPFIRHCKKIIDNQYKPDGYNLGINIGEDAGQTIFHLHIHLIPRYKGDVENPKGGIRNLKKALVDY